ncbi:LamB/YcsF family protein [Pseudodonghicola xiamenensis]|uniref:5-oxoprolinase subunit A n=1 Tax=Pseudodonghicola xiamenensis TaxID=337702 RepID=A0A8J3MDV6_9RHOB|nr:5-oxoprolinase subunit PxpA [Pseudodonghicola xiamenensis]GHH01206.1 LamB/YcsF family protein [Pseudodonghicola xiamenensis]
MKIDLNCDMGEAFGPWRMGEDAALLDLVSSINVACGFHAGDPQVMAATMRGAVSRGVGIGAHPGFADLQGFGRRRMTLSADELGNIVAYQLGAAQAMARRAGGRVRHLKLHGALSNMAAEDVQIARACFEAALRVEPGICLFVLPQTAMEQAARELQANWVGEIFADRAYADDGSLVSRSEAGAVLDDPAEVGARIEAMLREGAIIAASGKRIPCRIDTVCLHGDGAEAVVMARALRDHLVGAGIAVSCATAG